PTPFCTPAEGDSEPQTAKPRQDGTPYQTVMTGNGLEAVQAVPASVGVNQWAISFTLNEEASDIFAEFTGSHIGQTMAIVLDGIVISAPIIQAQIRDSGQISGNFTQAEAENLAIVLRFGMLPVSFVVVDVLQ
ncbi:MAG: protein translocase subunit SecD, partial [Anaerolineae bacterium]|nr:protein translocase subunit SecD [Anaerolineae bacterium]